MRCAWPATRRVFKVTRTAPALAAARSIHRPLRRAAAVAAAIAAAMPAFNWTSTAKLKAPPKMGGRVSASTAAKPPAAASRPANARSLDLVTISSRTLAPTGGQPAGASGAPTLSDAFAEPPSYHHAGPSSSQPPRPPQPPPQTPRLHPTLFALQDEAATAGDEYEAYDGGRDSYASAATLNRPFARTLPSLEHQLQRRARRRRARARRKPAALLCNRARQPWERAALAARRLRLTISICRGCGRHGAMAVPRPRRGSSEPAALPLLRFCTTLPAAAAPSPWQQRPPPRRFLRRVLRRAEQQPPPSPPPAAAAVSPPPLAAALSTAFEHALLAHERGGGESPWRRRAQAGYAQALLTEHRCRHRAFEVHSAAASSLRRSPSPPIHHRPSSSSSHRHHPPLPPSPAHSAAGSSLLDHYHRARRRRREPSCA